MDGHLVSDPQRFPSGARHETAILLHPPLPLAGVPILVVMERVRQQNDSLVNGYARHTSTHVCITQRNTHARVHTHHDLCSAACSCHGPRTVGIKHLADYVHSKGMKLGGPVAVDETAILLHPLYR